MFQHTSHSASRSAHRGLSDDDIEYVLYHGTRYYRDGACIYFLRQRDLPPSDRRFAWASALVGTALVLSADDTRSLITAWRNRRNGLKNIRHKPDHRTRNGPGYTCQSATD